MSDGPHGVTPLSHLGVIRVDGDDAVSFLQGQLTQDFALLGPQEARLAAFCNPKGRMQASFVGYKPGATEIVLIISRDILAPTLKRLSMFVLRAKAKLRDATADYALFGIAGESVGRLAPGLGGPWTRIDLGEATVVGLYPADGVERALWVAPAGSTAPQGPAASSDDWLWTEARSGVATVTAPIVEAFVPQMLNYESVGGVNFKKGCYPGQEVVARSQFRGTLKRRAYLVHSSEPLKAGDEVFHSGDASQPCGLVAQAARSPRGGWDSIVSMQVAAAQSGSVTLGGPQGTPLAVSAPPYPLLADI